MSEHALDAAPTGFTPPTSPSAQRSAPPTSASVVTLDGDAPRLGASLPPGGPSSSEATAPAEPGPYSLDGDAPRLGSSGPIVAAPQESGHTPQPAAPPSLPVAGAHPPSLSLVSPVLSSPTAPMLPNTAPTLPGPNDGVTPPPFAPTLPSATVVSAASTPTPDSPESATTSEPVHPMAHLMPTKQAGPNEASRRAAEKRAIQKAKAKKTKIGVISGLVLVTALAGPPLARWVIGAINEAGNTTTVVDEPAE